MILKMDKIIEIGWNKEDIEDVEKNEVEKKRIGKIESKSVEREIGGEIGWNKRME